MLALGLVVFSFSRPVLADPSGGRIISGSGAISRTPGSSMINQVSDRLIIEWDSFDTSNDQSVRFIQPSASSSVLNRVLSNSATIFDGTLFANGNVVIVNQAGIHFGPNSRVDVGSLIASTADISNSNFLNKRLIFDRPGRPDASITNAGSITVRDSGLAALVAPGVENSGLIQAHLGTVILGAGEAHTVDFNGDGLMSFTITKPTKANPKRRDGTALGALVTNSGTVQADGGSIVMAARQASRVVDNAINMSGVARANSVGLRNGKIVLSGGKRGRVRVSGKIRAGGKKSGQRGGSVHVTGRDIIVAGGDIDAGGHVSGGEVLIGGAYKGGPLDGASSIGYLDSDGLVSILTGNNAGAAGDTYIPTSSTVFFGSDATINVSGLDNGDGGQVILWADQTAVFNGLIFSRGGNLGGDGGFIETSAAGRLGVGATAQVDARAPNGTAGDWLLDPFSVVIAFPNVTNPPGPVSDPITTTFSGPVGAAISATLEQIANADDTTSMLTVAPSVLNAATANVSIVATDTISFVDPVSMFNPGVGITAKAGGSISVRGGIATNNGDITLISNNFSIDAAIDAGTGTVLFDRVTEGTFTVNESAPFGTTSLGGAALDLVSAGNLLIGDPIAASNRISGIYLSGADGQGGHDFTSHISGLTQFNALAGASAIAVEGSHLYPMAEFNTQNGVIDVMNGTVNEATGSLELYADTVNLDGKLIAGTFVGGNAATVNVLSDTGGATIQNAVDVTSAGALVNLPVGAFDSFVVDRDTITIRGDGSSTVIDVANGPIEVAADGITLQDLLILGSSMPGETGILLDGTSAPLLTGASILNVSMASLEYGIESIGDIGDGNAATPDVTIAGNSASDRVSVTDTLVNAINLSDSDDNAVYEIRNLVIQDSVEDFDALSTGGDAIRISGTGGLTIDNVDIFGAGGDGLVVINALTGSALATVSNTRIGTAEAPIAGDGISFTGGLLGNSTLSIESTNSISASGRALKVTNLQSPSTLAINGGTLNGLQGALLVDNTFAAGLQGRIVVGDAAFIGGAGSTVFDIRTSAGGAGLLIDFTGASGTTIAGGVTGISLSGPGIALVGNTLGTIALSDLTGSFITLADGVGGTGTISVFDASNILFDGLLPSALGNDQLSSLELFLTHFPDDNSLGLIDLGLAFDGASPEVPGVAEQDLPNSLAFEPTDDTVPSLIASINDLDLLRQPDNPLRTGQISEVFRYPVQDALYVFEQGFFQAVASGVLGPRFTAVRDRLDNDLTSRIVADLSEITRRCGLLPEEYRIDCLGKGYSFLARTAPDSPDYQAIREELARAGRRLQTIAKRYRDKAKPKRNLPKTSNTASSYAWESVPVKIRKLEDATSEATSVIEESQTRLLRSAENSSRRRIHYSRVSRSLGASRRILRS